MKYPEPNASYKHEPKFIDRMKAAENEKPAPFTAGAATGEGRLQKIEHIKTMED
jgi:hypothetical protein